MFVFINNRVERVSGTISTLDDLIRYRFRPETVKSVSFNDIVIDKKDWKLKNLSDFDRIDVI